MKLLNWIENQKLSRSEAAKKLGFSESQLSRLITGSRTPSAKQVQEINKVTDGTVGFDDFFGEPA